MSKLTLAKINAATDPKRYGDGGGLFLNVARNGTKSWVLRITVDGKQREFGLGGFPAVSLEQARALAAERKGKVALAKLTGAPAELPTRHRVGTASTAIGGKPTFRQVAMEVHTGIVAASKPGSAHPADWLRGLEVHVFPKIGDKPVDRITRDDFLGIVRPLWTAKPRTGKLTRQRIAMVLDLAEEHGHVDRNIARGSFARTLPRQKAARHHTAAHHRDTAALIRTLAARPDLSPVTKLAFEFLVLTAARAGEVRYAQWSEIDFDTATWTVPAERMKMGREHRVPLSERAVAVLDTARELANGNGRIFPGGETGGVMAQSTIRNALQRTLGTNMTVHGFRSTFRDWCAENGKPRELAEAALAHVPGGVEGAYFRSDLFDLRRNLMQEWADYLTGAGSGAEAA